MNDNPNKKYDNNRIVPFGGQYKKPETNTTMLLIFAITSINIYTVLLSGWATKNKYGIISALRGLNQLISYEVTLRLTVNKYINNKWDMKHK